MARMTKTEFESYWDKAFRNPFTLVELPSGAKMVSNVRDVFVMFAPGKMQAITRDREWFGCIWEAENYEEYPEQPDKWRIKPADYCSI